MRRSLDQRIKDLQAEIIVKENFIKRLSVKIFLYKGRLERMLKRSEAQKTTTIA